MTAPGYLDRILRCGPTATGYPSCQPSSTDSRGHLGQRYSFAESKTASSSALGGAAYGPYMYEHWDSGEPLNEVRGGEQIMTNLMSIEPPTNMEAIDELTTFKVNSTIATLDEWRFVLPDNSSVNATTGVFGMGYCCKWTRVNLFRPAHWKFRLQQVGSLWLRGYEQNRALGPVGVFRYVDPRYPPRILLHDVFLGTAVGGSPFANPSKDEGSVWQGTGDNPVADTAVRLPGGTTGSALIIPNPAAPYIYLPSGHCEELARRLPLVWNERTGLYLWDTKNPQYERIVRSPAFLGFVFGDRTATNITIKVPMHLLNVTLEPPLMPTPTPYFPCKSFDPKYDGLWTLGRAFLQAAFLGINYHESLVFLAQAPGPHMGQSVIRSMQLEDEKISSNHADEFEKSWLPSWIVLEKQTTSGDNSSTGQSSTGNVGGDAGSKMSTGAIAGIAVAAVVVLAVGIASAVWYWRRQHPPQRFITGTVTKTRLFDWALSGKGRVNEGKPTSDRRPTGVAGNGRAPAARNGGFGATAGSP
ncbi:hypothetical protein QBC35DRAFT_463905 [Podospora australis]|uniref:Peptidase A1 domain-containing protein n=1 Tax=Podospora australis TaxID=1536484 RepID=A0AAN6WSW7_9PEZI|nr:hypothetical protein QBC35DRAFT_463905 [Podospora australis]